MTIVIPSLKIHLHTLPVISFSTNPFYYISKTFLCLFPPLHPFSLSFCILRGARFSCPFCLFLGVEVLGTPGWLCSELTASSIVLAGLQGSYGMLGISNPGRPCALSLVPFFLLLFSNQLFILGFKEIPGAGRMVEGRHGLEVT